MSARPLAPCGTPYARRRHQRRNETCNTCTPIGTAKPLAPCGTKTARERHRRRGETCPNCTPMQTKPNTQPCGTPAAYRRHIRHGETPCTTCVEAIREHDRNRKPRTTPPTLPKHNLIEEITFLLNAGEGTARILQATGYTGREHALRNRLYDYGQHHLATRIFNPWDLAA